MLCMTLNGGQINKKTNNIGIKLNSKIEVINLCFLLYIKK